MVETTLRFATWNMAHRQDAWASAQTLADDERLQVLLLQEATPPTDIPATWRVHPGTDNWRTEGRRFTTAIVWCDPTLVISPRSAGCLAQGDRNDHEIGASHPGTFAVADIGVGDSSPILFISAYGLLENGSSHTTLHRLLSDLEPLLRSVEGARAVLAGDLNSGDQPYDWSTPFHGPVWQRIELLRLQNLLASFAAGPLAGCSCEHGDECRHVRTQRFRQPSGRPWQADYILTMPGLRSVECRALNAVPDASWPSDHCPVIAEVALPPADPRPPA